MPRPWRSARGRPAVRVEEDRSTEEIEPSRHPRQTNQQVDVAANTAIALQDAEKLRSKRSFSRSRTDNERPRTAGGATKPASNTVERPPRGSSRAYASEAHRPAVQPLNLKTAYHMDEDMIGMALGSPSYAPFVPNNVRDTFYPLHADHGIRALPEGMAEAKPNTAKAGKWKMFGGLFKSKPNPAMPAAIPVLPLPEPPHTAQIVEETDSKPLPPTKETPEVDDALPSPEPTPIYSPSIVDGKGSTAPVRPIELPKLEVDIPDVQMDRYSVMFGSLLKGQPSSNLLARRSKALEKLKTSSDENVESQDPLSQPKQLDNTNLPIKQERLEENEQLKPPPSSRRATSPTPTKSPTFSLFPQPPTTPRRAGASTAQAKPSPLQRSFTAPSRLSPMEETFASKKPLTVKSNYIKRRKSSISLVETSASTTQGPGWNTDGSYLSANSSVSSVGDEILFDIKKLSMVTENQEPQYEVTNPDGETMELYRARSQKLRAAKPSALKLTSKHSTADSAKPSAAKTNQTATARSANEAPHNGAATVTSLNPEYLLPSMHFIPARHVETAKETPAPAPKPIVTQPLKSLSDVKESPIPELNQPVPPLAESPVKSPVEIDESAEVSHDILAAAVMGTLDHMGEQSSLRAASPMPDSPGLRVPTPEKPVKLLAIPKNIPISKYSLRSPTDALSKADPISQSASPQQRRAVTEPLIQEQPFPVQATQPQAAPAIPSNRVKNTTVKSNISSKIIPPQAKSSSTIRGPKPGLSIVAPPPAAVVDPPNSALSPIEVTVARQVSLSRKQSKRLLVPPAGKRLESFGAENGEKVVKTQALMPVIVDANKAHRPGKSLAVSIVNI